jgi:hypothetical protein
MGVRFEFINVVADSMESVCAVGADGAGLCWEIITDRWNGRNPLNHPEGKAETGDRDEEDGSDFGDSIVLSLVARHRLPADLVEYGYAESGKSRAPEAD